MSLRQTWKPAAGLLIVTLAAGCDNVDWGGAEFAVVPPPPKAEQPEGEVAGGGEVEVLPDNPLLYYVRRTETGATMYPVAEIAGQQLRPLRARDWEAYGQRFIAEHYREGTEYTLFRSGARVGTFVVADAAVPGSGEGCARLPQAEGLLELTPAAEAAGEFLALSKRYSPGVRRRIAAPLQPSRTMQVLGPILAERMLRARRAQLPGNWYRAMAQLQPFPLEGRNDPGFTATFVVGDSLGPGGFGQGVAYSLFFVAIPHAQVGFDTAFVRFANYPTEGKSAPRVVDFLDWDRDDQVEMLLEVYGASGSHFAAVGETEGEWEMLFEEDCQRRLRAPVQVDTAAAGQPVALGGTGGRGSGTGD